MFVGSIGALAVAFGVGTTVAFGGNCGLARANSPGSASSSADSSTKPRGTSDTSEASAPTKATPTDEADSTAGDETTPRVGMAHSAPSRGAVGTSGTPKDAENERPTAADATPVEVVGTSTDVPGAEPAAEIVIPPEPATPPAAKSKGSGRSTARGTKTTTPGPASTIKATHVESPDVVVPQPTTAEPAVVDPIGIAIPPLDVVSPETNSVQLEELPPPSAVGPNVITMVAGAITEFFTMVLSPFATGSTPLAPVQTPQSWALLAFARRELNLGFTKPSLDAEAVASTTTSGLAIDTPTLADRAVATPAALTVESSAAAVDSAAAPSVVVTAPPSFSDQFAVAVAFVQRAGQQLWGMFLKTISTFIGIDLYTPYKQSLALNCARCTDAPPWNTTIGLNVQQTDFNGWKVWEFAPPNPSGEYVVAIHGGGFVFEPELTHWIDYTSMARETGATVIAPLYPLETTDAGRAITAVPDMADFIAAQVAAHPGKVSLYADSSGASIALSAVQLLVSDGRPLPSSMVLLSPGVDFTLSNPKLPSVADPLYDYPSLRERVDTWQWDDGLGLGNPLVSPLYGDFFGFPPTTIYVGTLEIFAPDVFLLYDKAVAQGAPIDLIIGQGQVHDWPLGGLASNSQAPVVRPNIYRQLGLLGAPATMV